MYDRLPGLIHREMTREEFDDFPRRLGWKQEYCGGKIHVSPYSACVPQRLGEPGDQQIGELAALAGSLAHQRQGAGRAAAK